LPDVSGRAGEVLRLEYGRVVFRPKADVSGGVDTGLAKQRLEAAMQPVLASAQGTFRTELLLEVDRYARQSGGIDVAGNLVLRDLQFGTRLAEKRDFAASGDASAVTAAMAAWVDEMECVARAERCAKPVPKPVLPEVATVAEGDAAEVGEIAEPEQVDEIVAEALEPVSERPGLNSGGISPQAVLAAEKQKAAAEAAVPVAAAATAAPTPRPEPTTQVAAARPAPKPAPAPTTTVGSGKKLGETVATLGLLDRSGAWLQTPLVKSETKGRITNKKNGKSMDLTLIPKDGPPTAGSSISLVAIAGVGAGMTDLIELQVFLK
jgi:hypothetical protein